MHIPEVTAASRGTFSYTLSIFDCLLFLLAKGRYYMCECFTSLSAITAIRVTHTALRVSALTLT